MGVDSYVCYEMKDKQLINILRITVIIIIIMVCLTCVCGWCWDRYHEHHTTPSDNVDALYDDVLRTN